MKKENSLYMKIAIGLGLLLMTILIVIPLFMLVLKSFEVDGVWNWMAPVIALSDPGIIKVFINSLYLGVLVVLFTSMLALPLAFIMAKTEIGKHKWLDVVFLIPFMTPPYIGSMGWILFMQPRGFLEQFIPSLTFLHDEFFSIKGIVFIMGLHLFPFLYLIIKNALLDISASLEKAAYISGANFKYTLRKVILPLIFSSYLMGALLVFVKTISEFGTPSTLGRRVGFYVLTTEIHKYTSNWPIDFGKAAIISSILLSASLFLWYIQTLIGERAGYTKTGTRSHGKKLYKLGKYKYLAWGYIIGLVVIAIGVPYFSIISTSLMKLRGYGLRLDNLTLEHYQAIFTSGSIGQTALWNSFKLSFIAATICLIIGTFIGVMVVKANGRLVKVIDVLSLMSNTVPSIVIVVGLIMFWNAPWMKVPVYNTERILIVSYVVLFLPFTVQYVKSSYQQINKSLLTAASVCGANRFYTIRKVLLPLIKEGMLAGWIMTFIISTRELVGSLMIRPPGYETTATFIYGQFEQGNASLGMAMAVCTVTITSVVLITLQKMQKKV